MHTLFNHVDSASTLFSNENICHTKTIQKFIVFLEDFVNRLGTILILINHTVLIREFVKDSLDILKLIVLIIFASTTQLVQVV
jgi:hypothetical protein